MTKWYSELIQLDFNKIKHQIEILTSELEEVKTLLRLVDRQKNSGCTLSSLELASLKDEQNFLEASQRRIHSRIQYLSNILEGFKCSKSCAKSKIEDAINELKSIAQY